MFVADAGTASASIISPAVKKYTKRVMASPCPLSPATINKGYFGDCDAFITWASAFREIRRHTRISRRFQLIPAGRDTESRLPAASVRRYCWAGHNFIIRHISIYIGLVAK